MNWFEAIILGIVQGLTEFLPVSSSGHLELGKFLFGIDAESNFYFTLAVHGATVLSTIAVFWKDILNLFNGLFRFKMNEETSYVLKIIVSMIPVGIAGFFMKDIVENFFTGNMTVLGIQFLITAVLLAIALLHQVKGKINQLCRCLYYRNCTGYCSSSCNFTIRSNNCNRTYAWKPKRRYCKVFISYGSDPNYRSKFC